MKEDKKKGVCVGGRISSAKRKKFIYFIIIMKHTHTHAHTKKKEEVTS